MKFQENYQWTWGKTDIKIGIDEVLTEIKFSNHAKTPGPDA